MYIHPLCVHATTSATTSALHDDVRAEQTPLQPKLVGADGVAAGGGGAGVVLHGHGRALPLVRHRGGRSGREPLVSVVHEVQAVTTSASSPWRRLRVQRHNGGLLVVGVGPLGAGRLRLHLAVVVVVATLVVAARVQEAGPGRRRPWVVLTLTLVILTLTEAADAEGRGCVDVGRGGGSVGVGQGGGSVVRSICRRTKKLNQ